MKTKFFSLYHKFQITVLVLIIIGKCAFAQEKELLFENTDSKKVVKVMVGDEVDMRFKKPDVQIRTKIISITDTSLLISTKQKPFTQLVFLNNVFSISIYRQGNLSYLSTVNVTGDSLIYQIETTNGNEFIGTIISQDAEKVLLKTKQLGEITIQKKDITKLEAINIQQLKDGVLWFDNPQASRYFWAPNGYGPKKGEGYYQNVWILVNQWTFAPSDNFSIGAGIVPLFLFGADATPAWATAKFSIPLKEDQVNLGAGILAGGVIGEDNAGFGIAFGLMTFGSRDKNVSFGMGYGYAGGDWAKKPMVTISTLLRTGPRGYFISENYFINAGDEHIVLISMGGRRIVKRMGIDFGLFAPFTSDLEVFIAIPWLGITVPLSKRR